MKLIFLLNDNMKLFYIINGSPLILFIFKRLKTLMMLNSWEPWTLFFPSFLSFKKNKCNIINSIKKIDKMKNRDKILERKV